MTEDNNGEIFDLDDIVLEEIPGVSKVQAELHYEACLICLDYHQHTSDLATKLKLKRSANNDETILLRWRDTISEQQRRSWRDMQDATEEGATAIAILLVLKRTPYTIIERSAKGTGFDYWLLEDDLYDDEELFPEGTVRLEVSGILHAKQDSHIKRRVNAKLKQMSKSDNMKIPALVVVMEFSRPEAHMVQKS